MFNSYKTKRVKEKTRGLLLQLVLRLTLYLCSKTCVSAIRQGARALQAAVAKSRCGAVGEAADEASKVPRRIGGGNILVAWYFQTWLEHHRGFV